MLLLISKDSSSLKHMFNVVETHDDWENYDKWFFVVTPSQLEETTEITYDLMEEWACGVTNFYDEQYSDDCFFEIQGYSYGSSADPNTNPKLCSAEFHVRRVM